MDLSAYELLRDTLLSLDSGDKLALLKEMRIDIFGEDPSPAVTDMAKDLRESRFDNGIVCPHCGSKSIVRSGFYVAPQQKMARRQRYRCKDVDCGKTFNDLTASPFAGTHYPAKWARYIDCMVRGLSLKKTALEVGIHVSTAFFWRHKVLTALRRRTPMKLGGIVEADTTYYLEARKGKFQVRRHTSRQPRHRGGVAPRRGISGEQACILVAVDRNRHLVSKFSGMGRINQHIVDGIMTPHLEPGAVLCTDMESAFATYARNKGIGHEPINVSKGERVRKVVFHVQNVNAYHSRLKTWMKRFNGVSTRYLNNYLMWHGFIDLNRRMANHPLKMALMQEAHKTPAHVATVDFRPCLWIA